MRENTRQDGHVELIGRVGIFEELIIGKGEKGKRKKELVVVNIHKQRRMKDTH